MNILGTGTDKEQKQATLEHVIQKWMAHGTQGTGD